QVNVAEEIRNLLSGLFETDSYANAMELHHAMKNGKLYKGIISDAELVSINGIPLRRSLVRLGYQNLPFVVLSNHITNDQRKMAIQEGIADILPKPIDE